MRGQQGASRPSQRSNTPALAMDRMPGRCLTNILELRYMMQHGFTDL
jgi:hypothetical protein